MSEPTPNTIAKKLGNPGAGRPKGVKDRSTIAQRATLSELARRYTKTALKTLVDVCTGGQSEAARVSAATALLDRGYGKPAQEITGTVDVGDRSQRLTQVLVMVGDASGIAAGDRTALEASVKALAGPDKADETPRKPSEPS